jgi:hypothetical protein
MADNTEPIYDKLPWGRKVSYTSPVTGRKTYLYNIGVLAQALGRTPQTIRRWEVAGVIPETPFKMNGKRLYSTEHINAIVKCAESSHITMGSPISQTAFTKKVYREFQRVNDLFFKKQDDKEDK